MKFKFIIQLCQFVFLALIALALCFGFSLLFNFWSDYSYFTDTLFHYELARYVSQYFPHLNWLSRWGCGSPFFFSYPQNLYLLEAGLRVLTNWDMQLITFQGIFLGIFLASLWTALAVKIATNSWFLALTFLPFFYGSELLWANRNFARGATYHLLALATLFLVWYWKKPSKKRKIILILSLSFCSIFHPIVGVFALATAACFLLKKSLRILLPTFLVISYYYVPLQILSGTYEKLSRGYGSIELFPIAIKKLFYLHISPFSLAIAFLLFFLLLLFARKKITSFQKKVLKGALLTSFGLLIYFFGVYFRLPEPLYIPGLPHWVVGIYLGPFLSLIAAISLKNLTHNLPKFLSWITYLSVLSVVLVMNLWPLKNQDLTFKPAEPIYNKAKFDMSHYDNLFGPPPGDTDYRFAVLNPDPNLASLLSIRYDTPNVGIGRGNLGRKWFDRAIPSFAQQDQEKYFYTDWLAIRYIAALGKPHRDLSENKQAFTPKVYNKEGILLGGILNQAKPILEVNTSPTILLVGQDYTYDDRIIPLSKINVNSSIIVPIRGPKTLSKIALEELNKFDAVWLYGYEYGFKPSDLAKLETFVKNGGGLVIDTGFSPDMEEDNLPNPFPISKTYVFAVKDKWHLKTKTHPINQDININQFSPPLYNQSQPWKTSITNPESLKPWAQTILTIQEKPIAVTGQLDKGRVVWTGFNLPYHLTQYKNETESLLIKNMLLWVIKDNKSLPTQFTTQFIHPEKRQVNIDSPARGIIFREQFFPNWKVKVDKKHLKIYPAGPDIMYLPFPKAQKFPAKATFYYQLSLIEQGTIVLAIATVIALIIAFFKKDFPSILLNQLFQKKKRGFLKKWEEE